MTHDDIARVLAPLGVEPSDIKTWAPPNTEVRVLGPRHFLVVRPPVTYKAVSGRPVQQGWRVDVRRVLTSGSTMALTKGWSHSSKRLAVETTRKELRKRWDRIPASIAALEQEQADLREILTGGKL